MDWIKKLLRLGLHENLSTNEQKRVRLLNLICFSWYLVIIFFLITDLLILPIDKYLKVSISHVIQFTALVFVQFSQQRRRYTLARTLFIFSFFFLCTMFCNFLLVGRNIEYWNILLPLFSLLFLKDKWFHYAALLLAFIGFIIPQIFSDTKDINPTTAIILFLVIFLIVNYFKTSNLRAETTLQQQTNDALKDKALIEQQKHQLQELHDFQNQFFINVAHEIRTPLTILKGNTSKIEKEIPNDMSDIMTAVQTVKLQSAKIERIVDDVLDLTRMESGVFELSKEEIYLSDFINKVFLSFTSNFEHKNITYTLQDLTLSKNITLLADPVYMERAICNLILNAWKYTAENGSVNLIIDEKPEGTVCIEISDNGLGINVDETKKIFERFYQGDNSVNKSGGSGIGLPFSKEVLMMHNGRITVESEIGIGSTFTIKLPLSGYTEDTLVENTTQVTEATPVIESHLSINSQVTILLVEDQPDMRTYIKSLLTGYKVMEASDGQRGLEILKSTPIQYIITDYMMPNMNGYEFIQNLTELNIQIPIMMLTARTDKEAKMEVLRLGIDDYLTKPFESDELLVRIENGLKNFAERKEFIEAEKIPKEESPEASFITALSSYIETNCVNDYFGVPDISHHFALSVSSLYRKVKALTGLSTKAFIIEVRLLKSRSLYEANPNISIKELASQVGFTNYTYFNEQYQKRFGKSIAA